MAEILLRLQPAAGHQGVGDADSGGGFELDFDVVLIVLLQKGTVNDIENVLPVVRPVFFRQTGSHIGQLRHMLEQGGATGRKLDFLIQEFNREANTIGSKCSDIDIARHVVDIKAEIEKIREQVQNIE